MWLTILFALLVLADLALIGVFFTLGLAFGKSAHTSFGELFLKMLVVPLAILGLATVLFFLRKNLALRGVAILIAAGPFLYLGYGMVSSRYWAATYVDESGTRVHYASGPLREIEYAILREDVAAFRKLLPQVDVNRPGEDGASLLMIAMRKVKPETGDLTFVRALLEAKADPNAGKGESALTTAIYKSKKIGTEAFELLLDRGARLDVGTEFNPEPTFFKLIGRNVHPDLLELGLKRGIDVNYLSARGQTLLTQAVLVRNWPAALLLLDKGARWEGLQMPNGTPILVELEKAPEEPGLAEVKARVGMKP